MRGPGALGAAPGRDGSCPVRTRGRLHGAEFLYENGEFERIRPHLMPLECGIIFDGIPEAGDLFRRLRPADHHRCPGTGHRTNDLAGLDAHRGHTGAFFPPCWWLGGAPEPRKQRQRRLLTEDTDRIQMARGVWQSAVTVRAKETDHPAWHWLNARNLWRPEFPLPSCLRWLPASAHWPGRGSTPAPVPSSPWRRSPAPPVVR